MKEPRTANREPRELLIAALLLLVCLVYVAPFAWMISTSFKTSAEAVADPPLVFPVGSHDAEGLRRMGIDPQSPALWQRLEIIRYNYYRRVIADPKIDILLYARNTLIIASLATLGTMLSSSLVAYALAKCRWRGRNILFGVVLCTMMVPATVTMIPEYLIWRKLGAIGTNLPLWLGAFLGGPFSIFLLRQFYMTIPQELSDAARIDGCSELGIWWRIILPLSRPALAVVGLFAFMGSWREFVRPLLYFQHQERFTLSLFLQSFQSQSGGTPWELLMAASLLTILPILVLFFLTQKTFVQGIATTGMKG